MTQKALYRRAVIKRIEAAIVLTLMLSAPWACEAACRVLGFG